MTAGRHCHTQQQGDARSPKFQSTELQLPEAARSHTSCMISACCHTCLLREDWMTHVYISSHNGLPPLFLSAAGKNHLPHGLDALGQRSLCRAYVAAAAAFTAFHSVQSLEACQIPIVLPVWPVLSGSTRPGTDAHAASAVNAGESSASDASEAGSSARQRKRGCLSLHRVHARSNMANPIVGPGTEITFAAPVFQSAGGLRPAPPHWFR